MDIYSHTLNMLLYTCIVYNVSIMFLLFWIKLNIKDSLSISYKCLVDFARGVKVYPSIEKRCRLRAQVVHAFQ